MKLWRGLKTLFIFGAGILGGLLLAQCNEAHPPDNWIALQFPKRDDGTFEVGYAPKAMAQVAALNLEPPQVLSAKGRAKFVSSGERGASYKYPLGYEVEIDLAALKQMEPLPNGITNVGCVIGLSFALKDKDGFELMRINEANARYALAGESLKLKGTTTNVVSLANARAVRTIECNLGYEDLDNGEPKEVDWEQLGDKSLKSQ